jgi:predicted Zn-dependent peptidase
MAAVNILYKVGARNEDHARTGFAHLFEHLMFRGTKRVPDFDLPVQQACGENNAFTNNDYTDYYITLPKDNIETALWLEADRMTGLNITPEALGAEKRVVIEEYNQRYLNQPYGDSQLLLRELAYKVHPYRWATIGMSTDHIAGATLDEVKAFYTRWYNPSNAILSISANLDEDYMLELAEKWFGGITGNNTEHSPLPQEPLQTEARRLDVTRKVPATAITIAFKMSGRTDRQFYLCDIMSDILAGGASSRLYLSMVKERKLFSAVNAYVSGDIDPGLFVVTGQLNSGISPEAGEKALWEELRKLQSKPVGDYELEKVKNKFEASTIFGELNVMNKAMNLGFYSMLGDMSLLNGETAIFRSISAEEIMAAATAVFRESASSTLIYRAEDEK